MPDAPTHLIVGRVRRAHGIRGDVVVEPLTDAPDAIFAPGRRVFGADELGAPRDGAPLAISRVSPFTRGSMIVHFEGLDDRTAAEAWHDRYLVVPASEVEPPGASEAFLHELPGMHVVLEDGTPVGEVLEYYEVPQGVMVEVEWKGARAAIPLIDPFLRDLDRAGRRIVMQLPDGLLE